MTRQDWIIVGAGWLALAAVIVGLMLDQRRIERRLRRHRLDLSQHAKRLLQIETAQRGLATSTRAPMPTVGQRDIDREMVPADVTPTPTIWRRRWTEPADTVRLVSEDDHYDEVLPAQPRRNVRRLFVTPDPDDTVRLGRPPALGDIEHVLTKANNRPHTGVELARALHRKPWDLLPELDRLVASGRVELISGHTAGHVAYRLVETVRMPHRHLLPGSSAR